MQPGIPGTIWAQKTPRSDKTSNCSQGHTPIRPRKGSWGREISMFQGNLGWWDIFLSWPELIYERFASVKASNTFSLGRTERGNTQGGIGWFFNTNDSREILSQLRLVFAWRVGHGTRFSWPKEATKRPYTQWKNILDLSWFTINKNNKYRTFMNIHNPNCWFKLWHLELARGLQSSGWGVKWAMALGTCESHGIVRE